MNAGVVCGIVLFAVGLVVAMNAVRPLPFGSTGDGPIYFLPLIKTHTDALLGGRFVAIDWRLGCGWTPWEGFLAGPFYPPYLFANLLSRLLGEPLALLDVSAALHLAFAGVLMYGLTAGRLDQLRRGLWACLAIAQPAPLLIGMNWHNYLTCYPWFIGVMLLLWRSSRGYSMWTAGNRFVLVLLLSGFFLADFRIWCNTPTKLAMDRHFDWANSSVECKNLSQRVVVQRGAVRGLPLDMETDYFRCCVGIRYDTRSIRARVWWLDTPCVVAGGGDHPLGSCYVAGCSL